MASWQAVQGALITAGTQLGKGFGSVNSVDSLHAWLSRALVTHPDPAVKVVAAALVAAVVVFLLSLPTNNYSWVDKSWSLLPVYYAYVIVTQRPARADIHPRLAIIAALVSIWGTRLTYNFYRKGGYAWSGEDYRWPVLRRSMHPIVFQIFNLGFIAIIQNLLLASILSPVYVAWTASYGARGKLVAPLNVVDAVAAALAAGFLIMEAVADQQQWNFHQAKRGGSRRRSGDFSKGFLTSGLWSLSRHPNFFAEQAFWWSLCLFATAATGKWTGWWLGGAIALSALFQGSTSFTEKISASKYAAYKQYQNTTSRLMPWFPAPSGRGRTSSAPTTPRGRRTSAAAEAAVPKAETPREVAAAAAPAAAAPAARRGRASSASRKSSNSGRSRSASAAARKPSASRSRSRSTSRPASARAAPKPKAAPKSPAAKSTTRRSTRARKA